MLLTLRVLRLVLVAPDHIPALRAGFGARRKTLDMRRELVQKALGAGVIRHGITHGLRIPLATSISRPQLARSLRQVMTDPTASSIHPDAFGPPDTQSLNLGSLNLANRESVEKAFYLLKTLKVCYDGVHQSQTVYRIIQL